MSETSDADSSNETADDLNDLIEMQILTVQKLETIDRHLSIATVCIIVIAVMVALVFFGGVTIEFQSL